MPTLFIIHGFRFFFFNNDGEEPIHIHVEKAGRHAKFWLHPVCLGRNNGFSSLELRKIMKLIEPRVSEIEERWNEYFGIQ